MIIQHKMSLYSSTASLSTGKGTSCGTECGKLSNTLAVDDHLRFIKADMFPIVRGPAHIAGVGSVQVCTTYELGQLRC